jgi:effector-binding domain-containing protein
MADITVSLETVQPRRLAAVRRRVLIGQVAEAWKPALDKVWEFLRQHPGVHAGGHNVFLYHHGAGRDAPMTIDFGVEVARAFEPSGEVLATETPAGEVALAVHVGPYANLRKTHDAVHAWCAKHQRAIAGYSWEIYGDWTDDASKLETTVAYLLG